MGKPIGVFEVEASVFRLHRLGLLMDLIALRSRLDVGNHAIRRLRVAAALEGRASLHEDSPNGAELKKMRIAAIVIVCLGFGNWTKVGGTARSEVNKIRQ